MHMLREPSTLGFKILNTEAQDLIIDQPFWTYLEEKKFGEDFELWCVNHLIT